MHQWKNQLSLFFSAYINRTLTRYHVAIGLCYSCLVLVNTVCLNILCFHILSNTYMYLNCYYSNWYAMLTGSIQNFTNHRINENSIFFTRIKRLQIWKTEILFFLFDWIYSWISNTILLHFQITWEGKIK